MLPTYLLEQGMSAVSKEVKERHWKKKHDEAPEVECACGCGQLMKSVDLYGRNKRFITGHNGRKYPHAEKQPHKKAWVRRNRQWVNSRRQVIARKRKVELIHHLGGQCVACGLKYNGENGAVFEFHHTDPSTKEFGMGSELTNRAFAELKAEADKCVLLCANCHQIEHLGAY